MKHILVASFCGVVAAGAPTVWAQEGGVAVPARAVVGYSVTASAREAGISFQLADGTALRVLFDGGRILVDGQRAGEYTPDGALEHSWRHLLSRSGDLTTDQMVVAMHSWQPNDLSEGETAALDGLRARLAELQPVALVDVPVLAGPTVEGAAREAADAATEAALLIRKEAIELARDRMREAASQASRDSRFRFDFRSDTRAIGASPVETIWQGGLGILGAFIALASVAFGASFFAQRQLDVVADTVSTSFVRSFFVGLFAQPLIVPVFILTLVALALSVIGILLLPVAVIALPIVLATLVIGGYLAVARVVGAGWLLRRRQAFGAEGVALWKSLAVGLAILLAVWVPAVLLSWAPVAGAILFWTAALGTWILATTGFGAMILTRGGLRGTFGRRFAPPPVTPDELFPRSDDRITTGEWLSAERTTS